MAENQNAPLFLMEVSHDEFQQYMWNRLWDTWKTPFMISCRHGVILISMAERITPQLVVKGSHA
jgi:hypothetical protein